MFRLQTLACLKIEGRLKGPEYVAVTTAAYRQARPDLRSFQILMETLSFSIDPLSIPLKKHKPRPASRLRGARRGPSMWRSPRRPTGRPAPNLRSFQTLDKTLLCGITLNEIQSCTL